MDEHCVPVCEEAVVVFQGRFVGVHEKAVFGKSAYSHQERCFRLLEVCDERIGYLELVGGIDEFVGPALSEFDFSVYCGVGFKNPAGGGADCNDPSVFF